MAEAVGLVLLAAGVATGGYHPPAMSSRWFVLVLVLLLPLRGWLGDAMAGQVMPSHGMAAAHAAAAAPAGDRHDGDCHAHGSGPAVAAAGAEGLSQSPEPAGFGGHADCPTCPACQACSAVGLQPAAAMPLAGGFSQPAPRVAARGHASAAPAPLLKPPIS